MLLAVAAAAAGCASPIRVDRADEGYETSDDPAGQQAWAAAEQALARGEDTAAIDQLEVVVERLEDFVPGHVLYQDTALRLGGATEQRMRARYRVGDGGDSALQPYLASRLAPDDATRMKLLDAAIEQDRSLYYAYHDKAELWLRNGNNVNKAFEELRRALAARPDYPPSNLALARILDQRGKGATARTYYTNYLQQRPQDRAVAKEYVELLIYKLGEPGDATAWIDRLLAEDPDDVEALMDRGAELWLRGDADGAAEVYRDVLRLDATAARAVLNLGNLYFDEFPRQQPDRRAEHWARARTAYLLFLEWNRSEDFFDSWDRFLGLPYRLAEIDQELGQLPAGYVPSIGDL